MKRRLARILTGILMFAAFWAIFFFAGRHMLFIQEQTQMFRFDWHYIFDNLILPGGFTRLLTESIVQFCYLPWLGTALLALVAASAVLSFRNCIQVLLDDRKTAFLLALSPVVLLVYCAIVCMDTFPLVAFALTAPLSHIVMRQQKKAMLVTASLMSVILYFLCAQTAVLLPLLAAAAYISRAESAADKAMSLLPMAIYLVSGYFMVRLEFAGPFAEFIGYHYPMYENVGELEWNWYVMAAWCFVLIPVVAAIILSRTSDRRLIRLMTGSVVAAVPCVSLWLAPEKTYAVNVGYEMYRSWAELHYLYTTGEYDDIIGIFEDDVPQNSVESNYLNLALYRTGRLTSDFFRYRPAWQHFSLRSSWIDMQFPFPFIWVEVCNQMGAISKAQQAAFEGNLMAGPGGSAQLVRYLAESEIIRGNYVSADKYLSYLEDTIFYRKWASAQRGFLNDGSVASDSYLSVKRACLYDEERTLFDMNDLWLMTEILKNNPDHRSTYDYTGIMLLSAGELHTFVDFIMKMTVENVVTLPMPPIFQDAMAMAFVNNQKALDLYGIDKERVADYKSFVSAVSGKMTNKINANAIIAANKHRVWYHIHSVMQQNSRKQPQK